MKSGWSLEARRVAVGLAVALGAGFITGYPQEFILAGVVAYLAWQLINLHKLQRWLESPQDEPPESGGLWSSVFSSVRRITKRDARRRQRLRKVVEDFRQAAEASPDAAVVLRDNDEIAWMNTSATRFLGLKYPRDLNQKAGNLIRNPDFTTYLNTADYDQPLNITSPVDENVKLSIRIVPYGPDRRLMLARDVTRLHQLEQVRKDFVANVSHELRSPLTVIVGYLETLVDDTETPDDLRRPMRQMAQQANRMCLIVEDLLRLSKIENQPGAAPKDQVDVAEMLEKIRAGAVKLGDEPHQISIEADPTVRVLGDYGELYSAFSNLIFNAVQYTPGGGQIDIRWVRTGAGARFEVRDTGIGIEPHHLSRLTERFYRVDKGRSREAGGTGLGLAIVKHVLVRHNAVLDVTSDPGAGSTFCCVFPTDRVRISAAATSTEPS